MRWTKLFDVITIIIVSGANYIKHIRKTYTVRVVYVC